MLDIARDSCMCLVVLCQGGAGDATQAAGDSSEQAEPRPPPQVDAKARIADLQLALDKQVGRLEYVRWTDPGRVE